VYESVVIIREPMSSEADLAIETGIFQRVPIKRMGRKKICHG